MNNKLLLSLALLGTLVAIAPANAQEHCREFTTSVRIGGKLQKAWGTSCLQPDGSWQIVSDTPQPMALNHDPAYLPEEQIAYVVEKPVYVHPRRYPDVTWSMDYFDHPGWGHRHRGWGSGVGIGFGRHW
jgi:hypothetical protein